MKYFYPITIEQNFEPELTNDPTVWLVQGVNQAKLLPPLCKGLLASYGALEGQVTQVELKCQTPLGSMVVRLQDSRHKRA